MFYNLGMDIFGELVNWRMVHRRMGCMEDSKLKTTANNEEIKEYYRHKIVGVVNSCDNERWLKIIYTFVKSLLE